MREKKPFVHSFCKRCFIYRIVTAFGKVMAALEEDFLRLVKKELDIIEDIGKPPPYEAANLCTKPVEREHLQKMLTKTFNVPAFRWAKLRV